MTALTGRSPLSRGGEEILGPVQRIVCGGPLHREAAVERG